MASFTTQYDDQINTAATANGIDPSFLKLQLEQESGLNNSPSGGNGGGIAQFQPATAAQYGVDTSSVTSGINGAAAYDAALLKQTGSYQGVLNSYGTVPASAVASGNLAPGQSAVLAQAQDLDGVNDGGMLNGDGSADAAESVAKVSFIGGGESTLQMWFSRIAAVVVGIVLIGIGLSFLKPGLTSSVIGSMKGKAKDAAEAVT